MPPAELVGVDADAAVEQLYAAHWRQLVRLATMLVRDQAAAGLERDTRRITVVE